MSVRPNGSSLPLGLVHVPAGTEMAHKLRAQEEERSRQSSWRGSAERQKGDVLHQVDEVGEAPKDFVAPERVLVDLDDLPVRDRARDDEDVGLLELELDATLVRREEEQILVRAHGRKARRGGEDGRDDRVHRRGAVRRQVVVKGDESLGHDRAAERQDKGQPRRT